MSGADDAPLILTLRLDDAHQALFDRLRSGHFPAARNYLKAHVTLFHALPGDRFEAIREGLASEAQATPAPRVDVEAPYSLGRGVAFRLVCDPVDALRRRLADEWRLWLTPQDQSKRGLHVTVQNKVSPADAKALLQKLRATSDRSVFDSPGLDLWRYRGGPWEHAGDFRFGAPSPKYRPS